MQAPARDRFGRPQRRTDDQPEEAVKAGPEEPEDGRGIFTVATESCESDVSLCRSCVDLVSITSTLLSALSADGHLECWDVCHGGRWQEIC